MPKNDLQTGDDREMDLICQRFHTLWQHINNSFLLGKREKIPTKTVVHEKDRLSKVTFTERFPENTKQSLIMQLDQYLTEKNKQMKEAKNLTEMKTIISDIKKQIPERLNAIKEASKERHLAEHKKKGLFVGFVLDKVKPKSTTEKKIDEILKNDLNSLSDASKPFTFKKP